ncbi:hypothetical protein [Flavobacterium sp.]|uniref:hypothetical protein n=1 Tax=Flavobacterium sp. TaxID=239 RepID=UPI00375386A2
MVTNSSTTITLIDGHFSSDDAFELLRNLYSSKIQFHQLKNFSSMERFGKEDKMAMERIPKLKESLESILTIMKEEEIGENMIEIKAVVNITFLK